MTPVVPVTDGPIASAPDTEGSTRAATATLRIAFVGPPGSGKGTQAALLAERYHLEHISTGELLRSIAQQESAAGAAVREVMAAGDLIPDDFVLDLVVDRIRRCTTAGRGFVLDGFPRTVSQHASFSHRFEGHPLDLVVTFRVGRQHLEDRLADRGRADDAPATVAHRLDSYRHDTVPMIRYMSATSPVVGIDGEAPVETVHARLAEVVADYAIRPVVPPLDPPSDRPAAMTPSPTLSRKDRARSLLFG